MIAVFVTFRFAEHFSATKIRELAATSKALFEGMPGLRSKLFSISVQAREARNVSIWDDAEAAQTLFSRQTRDRMAALYGTNPDIEFTEVCALVENSRV